MLSLSKEFETMLTNALSFTKTYNIKVTGQNLSQKVSGVVIPDYLLEEFIKKLQEVDKIIANKGEYELQREKLIQMEENMEKTEMIKEATRKSVNPYNVPEEGSINGDAAYYFPLGGI